MQGICLQRKSLVLMTVFCAGCFTSCAGNSSSAPDLTGTWSFTVVSQAFGATASATAQLTQSGNSVTGTVSLNGTPCATSAPVTGTVSGTNVSFLVDENGQAASLTGTANSKFSMISGTYTTPNGGCTNGDFGTWSGTKQ
jgi:hypothetical protein